jgi:hypothetical protein
MAVPVSISIVSDMELSLAAIKKFISLSASSDL